MAVAKKAPAKAAAKKKAPAKPKLVAPMSVVAGFDDLVESIRRAGAVLDTAFEARRALGRTLAVKIDLVSRDPEDKSLAGLAREYRALVAELVGEVSSDVDDGTFGSVLPAAVRHPPHP